MSFLNTALNLLREKREWTHVRDLAREALERELCTSAAADPEGSLVGTLYSEINRTANRRGFVRHGPMIGLKEWGSEIPPPSDIPARRSSARSRAKTVFDISQLSLSVEQLLAAKKYMPEDEFNRVFGDDWQKYLEWQRQQMITEMSDGQLVQVARHAMNDIQDFLLERGQQNPQPELMCDWIILCYQLEFHREGVALFRKLGKDQVDPALYEHVRKIARACEVRLKQ